MLSADAAEEIAVGALAYLAGEPEELGRFLAASGLTPATLRAAAGAPGFHAAILDHVLSYEPLLLAFAEARGLPPEAVLKARQVLAGPLYERDLP